DGATTADNGEVAFTRAQALRTPALWLLMAFTLLVYPVQAGISLHQAPYLIERGVSPAIAATIVSAFSLSIALGSLAFGITAHRFAPRFILCAGALLMTVGAVLMGEVENAALGYGSAIFFGMGLGGISTMLPVTLADYFGRAHYGAIRGIALPAQVIGQAAGPLLAGVLYDATGDYGLGLTVFAAVSAAAAVLALAIGPPTKVASP
ncbi:MAG: MFS transporter, partial [Chromatiales bacterium]|nr:MFS transporter [Chromatiales bacterium]